MFTSTIDPRSGGMNLSGLKVEDRELMIEYAVAKLKARGFRHVYTSMVSEACYYQYGDIKGVLRIAAHRYRGNQDKAIPLLYCLASRSASTR